MPEVECLRRGTTAGVEVDRVVFLERVEDEVKLSVREKDPPAEPVVGLVSRDTLEAFDELRFDRGAAELRVDGDGGREREGGGRGEREEGEEFFF